MLVIYSGQNNPYQVTVCYCSVIKPCQLLVTPWPAAHRPSLSFTVSQSLFKLMSTRSVMLSKHLMQSVQFSCSVVSDSLWPQGLQHARPPCPSPTPGVYSSSCSWAPPRSMVMPSNRLILCRPLLLPPSRFASNRVFSNESVVPIRGAKYWSFSFSISPSNEYSGLISFRMDWLDLLAIQGTLKSIYQHHSSIASSL